MTRTVRVEWMLTGSRPITNSFCPVGMEIALVTDEAVKFPRASIVPAVGRTLASVSSMIFLGVSLAPSPSVIFRRAISGLKVKLTGSTVEVSLTLKGSSQMFVYMKS